MQILLMVWNGINGHGTGTVFLKGLFILALLAVFWIVCELAKYMVQVIAKLIVDAARYLAIMIRGWPKEGENSEDADCFLHRNRIDKDIR